MDREIQGMVWQRVYGGRYISQMGGRSVYIMSNKARSIPGNGWSIEDDDFSPNGRRFSDGTYSTLAEAKREASK